MKLIYLVEEAEREAEEIRKTVASGRRRLEEQASRLALGRNSVDRGRKQRANTQARKLFQVINFHPIFHSSVIINLSLLTLRWKI